MPRAAESAHGVQAGEAGAEHHDAAGRRPPCVPCSTIGAANGGTGVDRRARRSSSIRAVRTYSGSCHCGRVRFEVTADLARVSECNCSICTRKGYLHCIVPPERFRLLAGEDALADLSASGPARRGTTSAVTAAWRASTCRARIPITSTSTCAASTASTWRRCGSSRFDGRNWEASIAKLEI